jgi:pyruvyltransferase
MEKKINIKWAKPLNDDYFNFGDDLNPYIIKKLSGSDVRYIHFATDRINIVKQFFCYFLENRTKIYYYKHFLNSFFAKKYIIAVGSILNWYGSNRCFVWGSGIIDRKSPIKESSFLAVRGKYTKERLMELGFNSEVVFGDPALLLPIIYNPDVVKKYELGLIPHYTQYEQVKSKLGNIDNLKVINLNNSNTEEVIGDFLACDRIISTSLHGLIVANAYGIRALWFEFKNNPLTNDNVKFLDYFSSVDIPEYLPFHLDLQNFDVEKHINLVEENPEINNIKNDLGLIQKELLRVAPFVVKKQFLKYQL